MIAALPVLMTAVLGMTAAPATYIASRGANHLGLLAFSLVVLAATIVMWIVAAGYRSRRTV
jgi:hypothetical protein